jgi:hypothetical protein
MPNVSRQSAVRYTIGTRKYTTGEGWTNAPQFPQASVLADSSFKQFLHLIIDDRNKEYYQGDPANKSSLRER